MVMKRGCILGSQTGAIKEIEKKQALRDGHFGRLRSLSLPK
jgi:hypothetical protein